MTDHEAMKMALEALRYASAVAQRQLTTKTKQDYSLDLMNKSMAALEAALAQPEQKKSIWVLTREINDHNQDGEYFVAAWNQKPTSEMLKAIMGVQNADHVLSGGGRIEWENEWFYLKEQA